jgi:hypothetical protein
VDTERQAEYKSWFSQLMARMEEPVSLKGVFSALDPFDSLDLSSKLASLQLVPENSDYLLRLEAAAAYAATKEMINNGPHISRNRLLGTLSSDAVAACAIGLNEDPCENLLTESLTCLGGSYVVFPGIVDGGTYILRNLSKALFLVHQQVPDRDFIRTAGRTIRAILGLSDMVATKAGIARNAEIRHSYTGVRIPVGTELTKLAAAVKFSQDELDALLNSRDLEAADIQAFLTVAGTLGAENYSVGNNPLHSRPLIQAGDNVVMAEPGILTATIRHAVLTMAKQRGVLQDLAARYSGAVWDTVRENFRYLGLEELEVSLPLLADDLPLTEGIFHLDRDKALYVQLVVDPLTDYDINEIFGTWDAKDLGTGLDARLHIVEQSLLTRTVAPNELLALSVLGGVGRRVAIGIGSKSDPPLSLHLAMPAQDLETITLLERGNRLALLQFARAYHAIRRRTEINASSVLDEYELYRHNRHGYYFSDDALPTAMAIVPGTAGDARRDVIRQRDPHGVASYAEGYVLEVTYLYGPDIPIYVPFLTEQERPAFLVECLPIPIWVVGPTSQDIPQALRAANFEIAETIAYWLWQCSPFLKDLLLSHQGEPKPLKIEIRLNPDDDWSRAPSSPPTPLQESIYITTSEASQAVVKLQLASAIMAHLTGPDNSGERELLRLLLTSAATLIAPSRDLTDSISQAVDTHAPVGRKKKLLVFDVGQLRFFSSPAGSLWERSRGSRRSH